jgi:hypothetical protein
MLILTRILAGVMQGDPETTAKVIRMGEAVPDAGLAVLEPRLCRRQPAILATSD